MGDEKSKLPKFNGTDFAVWKTVIEAYLISKNKSDVLYVNAPEPLDGRTTRASEEHQEAQKIEIQNFVLMDREVRSG